MTTDPPAAATEPNQPPFIAPCAPLPFTACLGWLKAGWADFRRAPRISLIVGGVIVLVSMAVSAMAWWLGRFALLATLLSGFVFIAPLICVRLYSVSRALEAGRQPVLAGTFALVRRVLGQAAVFALGQGVIILLWSRAGMVLNALFPPNLQDTTALLEFLTIGSAVGAVFALLTFAVAAFSLPMIADRDVDMVTAALSSVNAVLRNKPAMLLWAAIIVMLTLIGFATAFLGLAVIMPWLAYATWHGYRQTLDTSAWPGLDSDSDTTHGVQ